jgi:hypothetical protein
VKKKQWGIVCTILGSLMVMFAVAFQDELAYAQGSTPWWEKPGAYLYYNDTNVGIGTTTPSKRLQVQKTSTAPAIMVGGGLAGSPRIQTYGLDADSNAWMGLGTDMAGGPYESSI